MSIEITHWRLNLMSPLRSSAQWQQSARIREQVSSLWYISRHKKDRLARTSLSLVDLKGFEPSTSRMRTERSRKVVSFLPTDCSVWFDENAGRGVAARNTIPQFFNKEGVDSKLICGKDYKLFFYHDKFVLDKERWPGV